MNAYLIHFTLSKFHTRVENPGPVFSDLSQRFLDLTVKMINKFDQSTLDIYVFLPCHRRKSFLDFVLKRFCSELISIRYIQHSIEKAWQFKGQSDMLLEYYPNTSNRFYQFFGAAKADKAGFKFQEPLKTKSLFTFDYFICSQNIKVMNQIINAILLIAYESFFIYYYQAYFQANYASNASLFELMQVKTPTLLYFGLVFKASIFFDSVLKMVLFNFKELPKVLLLYTLKVLVILIQTVFLLSIDAEVVSGHYYAISNTMYLIIYVAIVEILTNTIFISATGNYLMMFAQACLLIFNIMMVSIPCFLIVAHILAQLFLGYQDDFNNFTNIYYSIMKIYEYTFGAVLYTDQTNAYAVLLNILLVIISYIGNVMLVNLLILFIDDKFSGILLKSRYRTLKAKYKLKKITVDNKAEFLFLIPANSTLIFTPIIFLSFFTKYKDFCSRIVIYLECILYGLPVVLMLNLVDNFNVLRVITSSWTRNLDESDSKLAQIAHEEASIKIETLKLIYTKLKLIISKESTHFMTKQDLLVILFEDLNYTVEVDNSNNSAGDTSTEFGMVLTKIHREKIRLGVFKEIVKRFSRQIDNIIDIRLLKKFLKKHLKTKEIDLILNYDFDKFEDAWKMSIMEEAGDFHRTVNKVLRAVSVISEELRYKKGVHEEHKKCICQICSRKTQQVPIFKKKS